MATNSTTINSLSISELLNGSRNYIIPIYQRNYAWGEAEITQLIQDIIDYIPTQNADNKNYYLGTLVVYKRPEGKDLYETIDGQQRFTTLSILVSVIKNQYTRIDTSWFSKLNLDFDSRKNSTETLNALYNGRFDLLENSQSNNESIKNAYDLIVKLLPKKLEESKIAIEQFCEYLFYGVKILQVPVPKDTDLNHYFEIMNNRGEQLEKHEVLKSKLLEVLNQVEAPEDKKLYSECLNLIWEACANMEKYLQYGFETNLRKIIFGGNELNTLGVNNFEEFCQKYKSLNSVEQKQASSLSISDIIKGAKTSTQKEEKDDNPERFYPVINFQNFLLHILRIQTQKDIPLDDKRLLKIFQDEIALCQSQAEKIEFVTQFIFNLLKGKFLFDKYVIKREYISGRDKWSLKRVKQYENNKISYVNTFGDGEDNTETGENQRILMLLSMFHVSTPTLVYKHWLNAALLFIFQNPELSASAYINYLETLAKSFVFDRFIAQAPKEYYDIIYRSDELISNSIDDLDLQMLSYSKISNNLVFNYLDYLLWRDNVSINPIPKEFEFTFRSSVEHYYPQNPMQGFEKIADEKILNSFGNLCLISHSKNSRLSNFMPTAKKEHYAKNQIDSIKQHIMMNEFRPEEWNIDSILEHEKKMVDLLLEQIKQ